MKYKHKQMLQGALIATLIWVFQPNQLMKIVDKVRGG